MLAKPNFNIKKTIIKKTIKKIKLSGKRLYPGKSLKYLGIKIDENLNWKDLTHEVATKLNRANASLFKIRNCVSFNTLKAICFVIFDSHINYASLIWGENPNSKLKNYYFAEKALKIINNQPRNIHSGLLFKNVILLNLIFHHESSKVSLYSVLRLTIMTVSSSGIPIELTPMVKTLSL